MGEKKETPLDEQKYRLLLLFAYKKILTGVDPALRRAVKWFLEYHNGCSDRLLEYGFEEASRQYWEDWEKQLDSDTVFNQKVDS